MSLTKWSGNSRGTLAIWPALEGSWRNLPAVNNSLFQLGKANHLIMCGLKLDVFIQATYEDFLGMKHTNFFQIDRAGIGRLLDNRVGAEAFAEYQLLITRYSGELERFSMDNLDAAYLFDLLIKNHPQI